jgi:hypothetical protein
MIWESKTNVSFVVSETFVVIKSVMPIWTCIFNDKF